MERAEVTDGERMVFAIVLALGVRDRKRDHAFNYESTAPIVDAAVAVALLRRGPELLAQFKDDWTARYLADFMGEPPPDVDGLVRR